MTMEQCQIDRLTGKPCHNEASANIDLTGTARGDFYGLDVCQKHLDQLTSQAKSTVESREATQQRERGW